MSEPPIRVTTYPVCGDWLCDDYDYDWETVDGDEYPDAYRAVKREEQIVRYHQPRSDWLRRLKEERDKRNDGYPLWHGKW